ncbi:hypothetical protein FVQ98_10170 [Ottowia sp. GY511]|uniref:DUF4124 domain-containing protein n=1 Tax=Ottowia flava TaxID=2675430 RepID=A0ABW4KN42_9BURK|nr:hypothetical protein [Ottowia sp. GY511]TXK28333.1 hypothetical protein FVQ98_10170 [Ottowia sp. GY511]
MTQASLLISSVVLAASLVGAALPVAAQERIYRCGNEYTNQIKGRSGCKAVEGGNVTVVRGTAPAATQSAPVARSSSNSSDAPAAPRVASVPAAPRIDTPDQRARDSDAKAILEQELRRAESRQAELKKEYNNGEPERQGNERNYQKYLDRVAEMKASIARNQSDIDGIKRELGRFR